MRKQDKYIFTGVTIAAGIVGLIDYFQQKEKLKLIGLKMNWENYNALHAFKKITIFGMVGGITGNEIYKWEFREEGKKDFSSDNFLRNLVREENPNLNPMKLQELKSITKGVKDKLYNEFSDQLVCYPESVGSLSKKIAISNNYDSDIVMPVKQNNHFGNMRNLSNEIHDKIEDLFEGNAKVIKKTRATSLLFQGNEGTHKIDIVYGREIGNYKEDKNLNLYIRRPFFWQKGKTFKTNIDIQKNLLRNKPKIREIIKLLKSYRDKNRLLIENTLLEQLALESLSVNNYGKEFSVTENLLECMDYIVERLSGTRILDYANSNNNLLNRIHLTERQIAIEQINNDLIKIKSTPYYIKEMLHR
ncbi:nucleotidyltransferase family protein [Flavobacterium caseinilyticum]|uniref:Nucleotidyltransferase n=1 Tax=Flavobacterium caseinilyticum TaxID=2541732 RepID=A0A4R5ARL8_9FLAO|nr:hypothetical protein [Flavobacterium caseinilyticum]TDD74875.1 hypothetical protein E0F89_13265 [Flavobacterium caseinilyticum]